MNSTQEINVEIYYAETPDKMEIKSHFHNSHEILFILEGNAAVQINDKSYLCKSGDLIFISNLESHNLEITTYPYKRFFLLVNPQYFQGIMKDPLLASILKHRPEHFSHVVSLSPDHRKVFIEYMKKMNSESLYRDEYSENLIGCYLQVLLTDLFRNYREAFPLSHFNISMSAVLEVQRYLEENYKEDLTLETIAKKFYINRYYLSHQFKEITGFSFKEYLILQRISRAKQLLFQTSFNITEVGTEAGFNNVNHFIRIFKKYEGITPYQYRKIICNSKE